MPKSLTSFLTARISEEETAALDARSWYHAKGETQSLGATAAPESFAAFVLAHDPDRILTECVARRRIIKLLTSSRWSGSPEDREAMLRLLALPYAGHPAFRDEWNGDSDVAQRE